MKNIISQLQGDISFILVAMEETGEIRRYSLDVDISPDNNPSHHYFLMVGSRTHALNEFYYG